MKKILSILLLAMIIPQIALAAWWNPFSWNKKQSVEEEKTELLNRLIELEEKVNSQNTISSTSPEAKEKIITQTIKVDNPELQAKIDALIKENFQLRGQIQSQLSLVTQLNSCKASLVDANSKLEQSDTPILFTDTASIERKQKLLSIDNQILKMLNDFILFKDGYGKVEDNPSCVALNVPVINQLLLSYRTADPKMTHDNLKSVSEFCTSYQYNEAKELLNYLQTLYIPYR